MNETPPPRPSLDRAALAFMVICGVGGMLWMKGPAVNTVQLVFRIVVAVIGIGGLIVVMILKQSWSDRS